MADFVVLSEDVFGIPPERLWAVKATMTVVGGKVVWEQR
jgi:predicted amidohydrolase YtcJ